MGDRNNPIKFGPEWLRNLAREGNAGTSGNNNQNAMSPNSGNSGASASPSGSGNTASGFSSAHASPASQNIPKVQLAKLRYGREEMLALYDRTVEAPPELKFIELLYQPRGKAPFALNNTFEDDMQRDNARSGPPAGNSQGERYGIGRGMGRCSSVSDGRGRPRVPFVRQPSTGRGSSWHPATPKAPGYSGGPEDDTPLNPRSSWTPNNGGNTPNRSSGEQPEWTPNKVFRSKRQGQATNWRQSREEGEEWRTSQDAGRSRSNQQEKWEREWGDRPTQDKSPSWNNNRRTWVGGEAQNNEENLPEWAVENAEACGGTFDSSGAFHGYSNDDTSLPKTPESTFPLTRSHTHGSFARSKTIEEGSEEWWASEKAKKLSPKRFDASDVKFKKQMSTPESSSDTFTEPKASTSKDDNQLQEIPVKLEKSSAASEQPDNASGGYSDDEIYHKKGVYKPKFSSESKTFDSHMRSDINLDEASDNQNERGGNFQSVMITPNNSLRQKHQNIVAAASEATRDIIARDKQAIFQLLQNAPTSQALENEMRKQQQATEDKIVDEIFDMTLEDKELLSKPKPISSPINPSSGNMSATISSLANSMAQLPSPGMQQMRLASPHYSNQGLLMNSKQNIQSPGMQGGMPSGMQGLPSGMQGMQMPGLQMGGLPPTLQQVAGMQALSMQVNMQQAGGSQQQGMKVSMQSGMQSGGMPGSMQASGMQAGMQNSGMQGPMQSLQSVGMTNAALNASLGLPIGPVSNSMGLQLQGPPPVLSSSAMNAGMGGPGMQANVSGMPGFPSGSLLGMSSANVANSSLFMGQNSNATSMNSGDIPMPNHGGQSNMYSIHGLQHSGSQAAFGSSIYSNMMQQPPPMPPPNSQILAEQWYYEDPEKNIQGPFSSSEMYKWYRAGFFSPNLMVRRAVDNHMRPLGSYGPVVPFLQMDVMPSFPLPGAFERTPGSHESMMNSQQALGLESVMNLPNLNEPPPTNPMDLSSIGLISEPPFSPQQHQMVINLPNLNEPPPMNPMDLALGPITKPPFSPQQHQMVMNRGNINEPTPMNPMDLSMGPNSKPPFSPPQHQMVINLPNLNEPPPMNPIHMGSMGLIRKSPFPPQQHQMKSRFQVDSLWSQPPPANDLMWAQQAMGARNDARVNNLPMFFWDQQPTTIGSNTLLPEDITKEMKTEDQILAQLRASQNVSAPQNIPFMNEHASAAQPSPKQEEPFSSTPSATPNLEELQKLIQADTLAAQSEINAESIEVQPKPGKPTKIEQTNETKVPQTKTVAEPKPTKSSKSENEKAAKNKENSTTKSKNKKKDEKKEELESKIKDEDIVKTKRRSEESSPSNSKKEDKNNKKDLEKEKKEWLKEGFTIVKGSEKNASKDNKKKVEEFKVAEEIERRRKEIERLAAEEDRKRKQVETIRKQEMQQQIQQRQAAESVVKKAPWSAVGNQSMMAPSKEGLTLAEIQRLEREKKLEQMKEQQQMMQIIAQQQAAALAREQEMQAGLGWAKKKGTGYNTPGQSLAEIQAEARKQAAVAAAATAAAAAMQSFEEVVLQPPIIHAPWGNAPNGGFWDTQGNQPAKAEKPQDAPKPGVSEVKPKKKVVPVVSTPAKKETTPAIEFETWCTTVLASWSSKIDVPTFVGFLKDIESPYEVKDYVKCYLGDSKDTNDFARNFLERRSKLLRVGMVTPSDDLCSPAMAVNPRTISGSDYQEGKAKKTKKNKMLKVDARILGFSVTAAEDRINVGDIDSV